jgi:hypothetical protein
LTAVPDLLQAATGPSLALAPNPFNPCTLVTPVVSAPGPARLEVFDLRGRGLGIIWEGWATPGMAGVPWRAVGSDGCSLAAGLYILRLHDASGRTALARAMLAK